MKLAFDPASRTVALTVELFGPMRSRNLRLLLDTGAMRTAIRPHHLEFVGYTRFASSVPVPVVGVTGVALASIERVIRLDLNGIVRDNLDVVAIDLASPPHIDGLLGMDFPAGALVTINTVEGWVEIVDI